MKSSRDSVSICWLRRDLRLNDNVALFHALKSGHPVLVVFIFDENILKQFEKPVNAQVEFIHLQLLCLQNELKKYGSTIYVEHTTPNAFFENVVSKYDVKGVYANEDYELASIQRDTIISDFLHQHGIGFYSFKDHVIFSKNDVVKSDGTPYTVFTPYSRRWKEKLQSSDLKVYDCKLDYTNFYKAKVVDIPDLNTIGFTGRGVSFPSKEINESLIIEYNKYRDFPALDSTSRLGIHLRFGTISIRQLVAKALELNDTFLNELIWRDFYHAVTWHFPHICQTKAFKKEYDSIVWRNDWADFQRWCEGKTGYPIVDAGMRQLNETGFMHNRVRMITASFLIKHLLIDWRWGEAYFANKLLDFDFAANNGGWQWAASSGCDSVPYFRIFNPQLQTERFDKDLAYIRRWIPEYGTSTYLEPMVEHTFARTRVLDAYKQALKD